MVRRDLIVLVAIYALTLLGLLYYNLSHPPINDGVKEYETYLLNVGSGWEFRRTLVNSGLVTTWLPAVIQRWTGLDEMVMFRVFPPIFYALLPVFTYLIARRYMATGYAVMAILIVLTNSHFLFFPDIGRVGVGIAFFAGMVWALLEKRIAWALVFAVLVVFAHYGSCLIAMGFTLACLLGYLVWKKQLLRQYLVVFCVLVVLIGVWHFWISSYSGWVMLTYGIQVDMPSMTGDALGPEGWSKEAFLDITTREQAVQKAIGIGWNSIPEAIEVAANWVVVAMTTLGLYVLLRQKGVDDIFKLMGLVLWLLIVFTVAVPWLSTFYGGMRVFFTSLPVLAVCFPLGGKKLAEWVHINPLLACGIVLVLFALSTSGTVYLPFGLEKTVPVYFSLGK